MVNRETFESKVDYTTVLSNFEGPLDLLLHLLTAHEIPIEDIFVSPITEQFLDYMRGLPYLDVDKVTEYLHIAATIIKIKAQSLLPQLSEDDDAALEAEEEKANLIRALEEYKLIKEETKKLKALETIGYYFKEPDKDVGEPKTVFNLDNVTVDGLAAVLQQVMMRHEAAIAEGNLLHEIPRDRFTVQEKVALILESVEEGEITFEELFPVHHSKPEIVTTFQALLELLKHQMLLVRQDTPFGVITISRNPDAKEDSLGEIDEYN